MRIIIDESCETNRIDVYLSEYLPGISRSKIQSFIKLGVILVNNKTVKPSYILKEDDILDFSICEQDKISKPQPENIPIEIVWEDENMAVVNKPSGMLTHPTTQELSNTLVNALLYKYGNNLSDINGDLRRGIVHRLDRNTSGLIMIAKNNQTHEFLVNLAIVKGVIEKDSFEINSPIGRHPTQPHKQCVRIDGKESLTLGKVLTRFKNATLVELTLITGRTHQIRVHMSSIGHPVYNDTLYGFGKMKINTQEQVLESYKLEFTKPFTQDRILLEIQPDKKFERVLNYLNSI